MRFSWVFTLLAAAASVATPSVADARNFLATGAQCRAQGGAPDSAVTSRADPDPVRNCYVRDTSVPNVQSPRRSSVAPSVPIPSAGGGAAGVLGGIAGVLGAGAALIDALPSEQSAPAEAPEPEPQAESQAEPSAPIAPARRPAAAPQRRAPPSSPQRVAADEKVLECKALLVERRNVEAKACFLEAKALYDEALAVEEASLGRPARRTSLRDHGRTQGKVPEGCLVVGRPKAAGVGCGQRRQWFWTPVAIRKNAHCPTNFNVVYVDPEDGKIKPAEEFPGRLQTCGEGVTQAWIDQ